MPDWRSVAHRKTAVAGWALVIGGGIALAEKWQPWAFIISGIAFLGWMILLADFALTRWHRYRDSRRHLGGDP
jgi:uncharacterized protein YjiS (DUF1127 family)